MTLKPVLSPRVRMLAGAAAVLLLAGCASVPPPTGLMTRAQQQLAAAEKAQAADYDPVDLGFAKKRYQSAQAAMVAKKYSLASDMANESLADARLAQTRAELALVRHQIRNQSAKNAHLRSQLLNQQAPASPTSEQGQPGQGNDNGGLPSQIVLPQPTMPAPASSTPAPASSSSAGGR